MAKVRILSIAGLDPSAGAGLLADVATFQAFACHGMAVVAGMTAQCSVGVRSTSRLAVGLVAAQIDALLSDGAPQAVKTGMLATFDAVRAVESAMSSLPGVPLVVDPVVASSGGVRLVDVEAAHEVLTRLVPIAAVVTPNAGEAAAMTGIDVVDVDAAASAGRRMVELGARAALVKGGHLPGGSVVDVLVERGGGVRLFERPRVVLARPVRGTGCALSAAIAAGLGRGLSTAQAVQVAGDWVHAAIVGAYETGPGALCLDRSVRVPGMPS